MSRGNSGHLQPINRYLVITPHFAEKTTDSGVYLPDEFLAKTDKHIVATVHSFSEDCSSNLKCLLMTPEINQVLVDASMVEEVALSSGKHYMVLENYVVGVLRGSNEM